MKDMVKMGGFLFIIAAVAGVLLAATEMFTSPKISENKKAVLQKAQQEVLPSAKSFEEKEIGESKVKVTIGFDEQKKAVGIVAKVAPKGYGGPIEMVLGLTTNGKISGVKILSQKETPGLGTKLADPVFLKPFLELIKTKEKPAFYVKQDSGDVDAITAATISSRAFCAGIRNGLKLFNNVKDSLSAVTPSAEKTPQAGGAK